MNKNHILETIKLRNEALIEKFCNKGAYMGDGGKSIHGVCKQIDISTLLEFLSQWDAKLTAEVEGIPSPVHMGEMKKLDQGYINKIKLDLNCESVVLITADSALPCADAIAGNGCGEGHRSQIWVDGIDFEHTLDIITRKMMKSFGN